MEIREEKLGNTLLFEVKGRLDAATSGDFEKIIFARLEAGEGRLLFDLANLSYISSAGLRVFLVTAKKLTKHKGIMALCGLQEHVKEVFDISGFTSILTIYSTRDEAIERIK